MSGRRGAGRIPKPTCSLGETSQVVTGSSGLPGVWVQLLPDKHGEGCYRMADGLEQERSGRQSHPPGDLLRRTCRRPVGGAHGCSMDECICYCFLCPHQPPHQNTLVFILKICAAQYHTWLQSADFKHFI